MKKKKIVEAFKVLCEQIEMWGDRELEDSNVEGSLRKKKTNNVEAFRYCVRKNREFESYPLSCSTVSL